jgi:hypothetical protein
MESTSAVAGGAAGAGAAGGAAGAGAGANQGNGMYFWFKFLYKNKLFDDVISDILWTVLIIFFYCCANAYLKIRANSQFINDNWSAYRCNPAYMPFAGMIMKPTNMSRSQYTQMNFEYCFQNILKDMSSSFTAPLYYTQSVASSTLLGIANALNDMRNLIKNIRDALTAVIAEIMGRVLNIMQPIILMMLQIRDMLGKITGIVTAYLYTIYGMYDTMQSGLRSVFEVIVIILIAMGAAIVALWIAVAVAAAFGPFGIPVVIASTAGAVAMTAIYIGIAIPLGIIANFLAETMNIHGLSLVPSPPSRS